MVAVVWFVVAGRTLGGVRVEAGWPQCRGVEVRLWADDRFDSVDMPFVRPAVPLREGMRCTLVYRVSNDSDGRVGLTDFSTRWVVNGEVPAGSDVDASWEPGDLEIAPHDSVDLDLQVRFGPRGCTSTGTHEWARPEVTVGHLGRSRTVTGPASPVFRGTAHSSCDR